MAASSSTITLLGAEPSPPSDASERLRLITDAGAIDARFYPAASGNAAVLWVFGAGGGLGGPAGGVYARLGAQLASRGVASLELDYRRPGSLPDCVADALVGLAWLETQGRSRFVLVGHSFGGAVVINAAARHGSAAGVVAMSSQTAGTALVSELSPTPVLFIHGKADEVLPDRCAYDLYARAGHPKQLIVYPRCRHGLDECRDALDRDLTRWLEGVLGLGAADAA